MQEGKWLSALEARQALGGIGKSTLWRRTKELQLINRGYAVKLGRRVLYAQNLMADLPALLEQNGTKNV